MTHYQFEYDGLTDREVKLRREKYGSNEIRNKKESKVARLIKEVALEPMFILLVVACSIYFFAGSYSEGLIMLVAIFLVSGISVFQMIRSENALQALKQLTHPKAKVIRNGEVIEVYTTNIVIDDLIVVEEGDLIPADASIIQSNDFSVNEAILTGESFSIYRDKESDDNQIYFGTLVTSGMAVGKVNAIGASTQLGKIGKSLEGIEAEKTPLQRQISSFVKKMAALGIVAFLIVWGINYWESKDLLHGLLHGLTLAMSILPEEIPVAFATFMALGAWRLMKIGVLTKQPQTVESLGSATVICIDKTGTITENKMRLAAVYDYATKKMADNLSELDASAKNILAYAMWSSEVNPFDPMEVSIHQAYTEAINDDQRPHFSMIHEYPLSGAYPVMTHIYENESRTRIVAAKGAWEAIIKYADLTPDVVQSVQQQAIKFAKRGYRVLGVASAQHKGSSFPKHQDGFDWKFLGLIALEDPPKKNIAEVLKRFYEAGIKVKIITGDYLETVVSLASKSGFIGYENHITGQEVMKMDKKELAGTVEKINLYARMFPDAKLKVIDALKDNNEVVAMTGDGVNDAPALKSAHIGVAMGKKGTETAKRAASVVILDDDLNKMADAVALGRKIYSNLKKAIQYIISIHIPIVLTVTLPLILGWAYANIFSPVHIIFFELIMGPTCSIIFENEPLERHLMFDKPRKMTSTFFSLNELSLSIIQGLAITAGVLSLYFYLMKNGYDESVVRTLSFSTIILSNIFLTLVNRSFHFTIFKTISYLNKLLPGIILITLIVSGVLIFVPGVRDLFGLVPINIELIGVSILVAFISVFWFEVYKAIRFSGSRYKGVKVIG